MFDKPLGRDRLGRLVYSGDVVGSESRRYNVGYFSFYNRAMLYNEESMLGIPVQTHLLTVDLAVSPERSNYQRYFADLGTLDEITDAVYDCPDLLCGHCPLYHWGSLYGYGAPWQSCAGFKRWLDEVATI